MNVRGGGHGVWTFENGTLSFLRILKGGAIRWNVVFERDGGALKCKAAEKSCARRRSQGRHHPIRSRRRSNGHSQR